MSCRHRDRCAVCDVKRESASSSVQAATFVKLSGDACIHTHEGQLLTLNIVILLHFLFFISLILHSMFPCSSQKLSMASNWISEMYLCTKKQVLSTIKKYVNSVLKENKVHNYILLFHLDVMDNFCDEQGNMECNIREIKNRKCNRITMLRVSSCPSCVWMQASPQSTA